MFSFAITFGFAVSIFFLIIVPWLAISGRRDGRAARDAMNGLQNQLAQLQLQVNSLRADSLRTDSGRTDSLRTDLGGKAAAPLAASLSEPDAPQSRRTKAAAAKAATTGPAVAMPEQDQPAMPLQQDDMADHPAADVSAPATPWQPAGPADLAATPLGPDTPKKDFEELIGTRWAIWVGGLALALGSLFLVKYTIEAGFFGPRARLAIGALFSLALVGAGEMLRRGALLPRRLAGQVPAEHAPLALTAAGTVGLFGTVYAAYAVYGFLPQSAAFILLGFIGVAAMAASMVHGQALAGLGLVGSYATPVLVGGDSTSRWPLVIFLLAVTAAGVAVQSRLRTRWLGWALVAGVAGWTGLLILGQKAFPAAELALMLASMGLFAAGFLFLRKPGYPLTPAGDPLPLVALTGLAAAMGLSFASHFGGPALHTGFAIAAIVLLGACAVLEGRAALAIVAAGLLPLGMILTWPPDIGTGAVHTRIMDGAFLVISSRPGAPGLLGVFAAIASVVLAALPLALLRGQVQPRAPHAAAGLMALAVTGGLAAPALVFAWAVRSQGLVQNLPAALILAAVLGVLAWLTAGLLRQADAAAGDIRTRFEIGAGGYGAGASLALGLAIALALPGLWMAVGFAVAALAAAGLNHRQPLPILRRVTAAFATTAILRAVTTPVLQNDDAWPVFNSYIIAYGLPVLLLAAAAWLLAMQERDRNGRVTLGAAGLMAAVYGTYTIRHAFHRPELIDDFSFGLGESGLFVLGCLLPALGVFMLRHRVGRSGATSLCLVIAGLNSLGILLLALLALVVANPWIDGRITGWPVFDSTFVGFLLPALALGVLAYFGRTQPAWFVPRLTTANRVLAIGLGYLFVIAQTRLAFVGQERFIRAYTGQAEQYAYSAVTLLFGVALLAIGFRLGSRPTRMASAVFVTLAVLKVFLFDMAELEGLLRALSFIGLGGVLIGIGLAYQRLLFDQKRKEGSPVEQSFAPPSLAPEKPGGERVVP
jgi:uncharacterized membrane protein